MPYNQEVLNQILKETMSIKIPETKNSYSNVKVKLLDMVGIPRSDEQPLYYVLDYDANQDSIKFTVSRTQTLHANKFVIFHMRGIAYYRIFVGKIRKFFNLRNGRYYVLDLESIRENGDGVEFVMKGMD